MKNMFAFSLHFILLSPLQQAQHILEDEYKYAEALTLSDLQSKLYKVLSNCKMIVFAS